VIKDLDFFVVVDNTRVLILTYQESRYHTRRTLTIVNDLRGMVPKYFQPWRWVTISVADPGCLSLIPDPDFYPSRIPDPGSRISDPGSRIQKQQQKREVKKKLVVIPFYVGTNCKLF
jgi:hypothetical protein